MTWFIYIYTSLVWGNFNEYQQSRLTWNNMENKTDINVYILAPENEFL